MILRAYLYSTASLEEEHCGVGYVEGRHGCSHEVVTSRAIYDVQLLVVPFNMEHSGEHTITIFLFYGEIVAHSVLLSDASATLDYSGLVKESLCEGCLTCPVIAKQGNVLDLVCLISFHLSRSVCVSQLLVCGYKFSCFQPYSNVYAVCYKTYLGKRVLSGAFHAFIRSLMMSFEVNIPCLVRRIMLPACSRRPARRCGSACAMQ